jgi:hypothetical protein
VPNRSRRRLSTAMSAAAALAVASPFAYVAVCDLSADTRPAPAHHEFVRAAMMTDLPSELMSALSQGLSQFGVNLPPLPSLTGSASPGLTSPGLTDPGLTSPDLTTPGTAPGLTAPGTAPFPATDPALTDPGLVSPGRTAPGRTSPAGLDPSLPPPSEMPISAPIGLDPGAGGTYPILSDPSLGAAPVMSGGSGGLVSDVMSAAQQLGAGQAIDLLKGMVMPSITQAIQSTNPAVAAPAPGAAVSYPRISVGPPT